MRLRMLARLICSSVVCALLGACAATGTAPIEATNPSGSEMVAPTKVPVPEVYRFYPGDELSVKAVNRPELDITTRVDPYGYIVFPYLGQVHVKDLTSQEIAERLTRGLQDGDYYKRVALGVSYVSSTVQYIYVLGEVKKPGPLPITGSVSLLEALGKAGGQTYDAEMSTVLWMRPRQSPPGVARVNLASLGDAAVSDPRIPNFQLSAGDIVYVPDSNIASFQRFMNRMFDILRPVVTLESGIVLYDSVERILSGRYPPPGNNQSIVIIPGGNSK
jgi:polysaccharide biosynthesis/export protein